MNIEAPRGDQASDLVDRLKYVSPDQMSAAHLNEAQLAEHPWSDTVWPIAKGIVAWRFEDPAFPSSYDWKENADYVTSHSCSVDQLSPAEKYDLLVGDTTQSLTHAMLKTGQTYYEESGSVASWMGICHGWSPASYMVPRPAKAVEFLAADGRTKIRFVPSDIKALTSLLWANGNFKNKFIGARCNNPKPLTDTHGRITDPSCYGENPGTWHLVVVNQIGVAKRSFVMDALHDTEIWNQPIYSYSYTYFNPETKEPVAKLEQAKIAMAAFTSDKFKSYRSAKGKSVVGIAMDLTYVAETEPSSSLTDSPKNDSMVTVHYLYDMELDASGKIIGGEWYSTAHPGFLWTPTPDAKAVSYQDAALSGTWNGVTQVPSGWRDSIIAASKNSQPVARIVNTIDILSALSL